jgi:hypothetical protein
MIPELRVIDGPTMSGLRTSVGVVVEVGGQPFLRQLDAIAFDAREADFKSIALGAHRLDLNGLAAAGAAPRPASP